MSKILFDVLKTITLLLFCNCHVFGGDLYDAVEKDNYEKVKELLIYGVDNVDEVVAFGRTALFHAVQNDNKEIVCALLKYGSDVNIGDDIEDLPIFIALKKDKEILNMLLKAGANLKVKNAFGKTPLHLSVKFNFGGEERMQMLISAGANIEAVDDKGRTPLMEAVINNNMDQVVLLVESGAKINVKDKYGEKLSQLSRKNKKIFDYLKRHSRKK